MVSSYNVSVVMCTFNGAKYIAQQLNSILQQTLQPTEIIIVDDASTDNTLAVLNHYKMLHPTIRVIAQATNIGFNKNFEYACSLANGFFIAIADQDDIWAKNKLAIMLSAYNGHADIIHCNSKITTHPQTVTFNTKQKVKRFSGNNINKVLFFNTVEGHCILMRKDFFVTTMPFNKNGYYDWWLALHACIGNGVQWVNSTLVARRLHSNNASVLQGNAITKGNEMLLMLPNFMAKLNTTATHIKLLKPIIEALKSNNPLALKLIIANLYNDIYFYKTPLARFFKKKKYINQLLTALKTT